MRTVCTPIDHYNEHIPLLLLMPRTLERISRNKIIRSFLCTPLLGPTRLKQKWKKYKYKATATMVQEIICNMHNGRFQFGLNIAANKCTQISIERWRENERERERAKEHKTACLSRIGRKLNTWNSHFEKENRLNIHTDKHNQLLQWTMHSKFLPQ